MFLLLLLRPVAVPSGRGLVRLVLDLLSHLVVAPGFVGQVLPGPGGPPVVPAETLPRAGHHEEDFP